MVPSAFVSLDALPLTVHGKLDRDALPSPAPDVPTESYVAPRDDVETALAGIWSDVLGVPQVGVHDNFFTLGGDSILSIQMVSRARQAGLRLTTRDVFEHQTIAELAPVATAVDESGSQAPVVGEVPLTPIQSWFFRTGPVAPHHFNQSLLLELRPDVDVVALRSAVDTLPEHHDALRLRFSKVDGEWRQHNADLLDATALAVADSWSSMEAVADQVHASLSLTEGPLFVATLFTGGDHPPFLLLVAHHLVVDAVSWRILTDDLDRAYQQAVAGVPIDLGPKTTSFRDWSLRMREYADGGGFDSEREHWLSVGAPSEGLDAEPDDDPTPLVVTVDTGDTEAVVRRAPGVYRTSVNDIVLAALAWAVARHTGDVARIELEGHGREDIVDGVDLSRTVGWFTSMFPVRLEVPGDDDPDWRSVVKAVRRQRRAVPGNGLGYGYVGGDAGAPIVFNYLGEWEGQAALPDESLYRRIHASLGQDNDPGNQRPHALEVVGGVDEQSLQFSWSFRPDLVSRASVETLAADFAEALRQIAEDVRRPR
jgi:non-ribosomal peptide synthase protein (TIGR01720 family)